MTEYKCSRNLTCFPEVGTKSFQTKKTWCGLVALNSSPMAKRMKCTALGVFVLSNLLFVATAESQWSRWYNSDNPNISRGTDNETLKRISLTFDMPCSMGEVLAVQCRAAGSNETFRNRFFYQNNWLHVPCNASGLLCRQEDQQTGDNFCPDYEVRVLCELNDDKTDKPSPDDSDFGGLGSNGGFIALAAGGSVVVPLVCVLVVQLRKSKREERQRQRQARQAAEESARAEAASRTADAPPAYEELFGHAESVSVISTGSVNSEPATDDTRRGSRERLVSNQAGRPSHVGHGLTNNGYGRTSALVSPSSSSFPPTTSSSSPVTDVVSPSTESSSLAVHSSSRTSANRAPATAVSPSSDANIRRSSSGSASSETSSSASSTNALLPSTISSNNLTHDDPPPAYDWPGPEGSRHVTVVMPNANDSSTNSTSSTSPQESSPPRRRFLGMHLSIFDLMAVIYPDPAPTPPPSYDDALKILGVQEQPEVRVT